MTISTYLIRAVVAIGLVMGFMFSLAMGFTIFEVKREDVNWACGSFLFCVAIFAISAYMLGVVR